MKKTRTLAEGARESAELSDREKQIIAMARTKSPEEPQVRSEAPTPAPSGPVLPQMAARMNIGARCRPEIVMTVKKVSLERQMHGIEPYQIQDILEEALQQWLTLNNYM